MKVFWSWQSDRNSSCCQYFVRDALKSATSQIASELDIVERPDVDHDTKGIVGTPAITDTIFQKIRESTVFVADVTPIGQGDSNQEGQDPKLIPNPNVMIELGFAEAVLGSAKIVCVANSFWYRGPESLPFDLRHRRGPLTYRLAPNASKEEKRAAAARLATGLVECLKPIISMELSDKAIPLIKEREPQADDSACWDTTVHKLSYQDGSQGRVKEFSFDKASPRIFVRVRPRGWTAPKYRELCDRLLNNNGPVLIGNGRFGGGGQTADGAIQYCFNTHEASERPEAQTMTQWFASDGEVWAIDCSAFRELQNGMPLFAYHYAFIKLYDFLTRVIPALESFAATPPFDVRVGATRLSNSLWAAQIASLRRQAIRDKIEVNDSRKDWTNESFRNLLFRFWNAVIDVYGFEETKTRSEFEQAVGLDRYMPR